MIGPGDIPALPRGVRVQHDRVRGVEVLLGPERVLMLDGIGAAILGWVDGARSVAAISEELARDFAAPVAVIQPDVEEFLAGLAENRFVDLHHG